MADDHIRWGEPGELYRPSNGTEGMSFIEDFCAQCIHDHPDADREPKCEILTATMFYDTNEPEYPKEWTYDEEGQPTCTKFVKWDWGRGDDDDGWNEPPPQPPPDDPNQMCLPFIVEEIERNTVIELPVINKMVKAQS